MKKIFKDKSGSSLVMVLITMTFVTMLAMTIVAMTITNIRLKMTQKNSQKNFYTTDSILDTISAGIQNASSDVSADAYSAALTEYNSSLTAGNSSVDTKYADSFLGGMISKLSDGAMDINSPVNAGELTGADGETKEYAYSDDVLMKFLNKQDQASYIKHSGGTGKLLLQGDSLVLKDVKVKKEENSLETTLTTDIRVDVPPVDTEARSEYLSYAVIADDQLRANQVLAQATINGNIYTGTVNRYDSPDEDKEQGIIIQSGSNLKINSEYIITRGDLAVADNSTLDLSGDSVAEAHLWAENIQTSSDNSSAGNKVTINAKSYIADDTSIGGDNDDIVFKGKYFGYNFSNDYSGGLVTKIAKYSSAIYINGKQDKIDFSGLDELILAGRTFISKKANNEDEANNLAGVINPDVQLGESLTVKSSQLAYLVPSNIADPTDENGYVRKVSTMQSLRDEGKIAYDDPAAIPGYVQVTIPGIQDAQDWYFFENSVTGDQYAFRYNDYQNYLLDGNTKSVDIDIAAAITNDQIDHNEPLLAYVRNDKVISGDDPITYFYLNFKDGKYASKFYSEFSKCDSSIKTVYDKVNGQYVDVSSTDTSKYGIRLQKGNGDMPDILLSAGNILYSDITDPTKMKVKMQNIDTTPGSALEEMAQKQSKIYMSRQLALIDDYAEAKASNLWRLTDNKDDKYSKSGYHDQKEDRTNLFDKLVDRDQLPAGAAIEQDIADGKCIISKGDVQWKTAGKGIIITSGDVDVFANFSGLILAGGDVNIKGAGGITIESDETLVEDMVNKDKDSASPVIYGMLSKYFRKSVDATIGSSDKIDENNVNYENWKKN